MLIDELNLREKVAEAFPVAYATVQGDPHLAFANLLGVSRQEAKTIAYEYLYTTEGIFVGTLLKLHKEEVDSLNEKIKHLEAEND